MDRNLEPKIQFKSNPFSFEKKVEVVKEKNNIGFDMFFPSKPSINEDKLFTVPSAKSNEMTKQEDWKGEYYYAQINEIEIPIPTFVSLPTVKKFFNVMEEIQKQVDSYLEIPQLKQQVYQQIHKEFTKKNEAIINKYNQNNVAKKNEENLEEKKESNKTKPALLSKPYPESHKRGNSSGGLDEHIKQAQAEYAKDHKAHNPETVSVKSHVSDKPKMCGLISKYKRINKLDSQNKLLGNFFQDMMNSNKKNCFTLYNDIQTKVQKQESQKPKKKKENKYPYLFLLEDYQLHPSVIDQIAEKINPFGSDKCTATQKINSALKTETIHFNFKENKVLRTIVFSILYELFCKKNPDQAKKFIYQKLGFINPGVKGFENENIILRQIYLHFLLIKLKDDNHYENSIEFLKQLFSFEFLAQLILEHFLFSSQKDLKIKIPTDNINEQLEQISKANNFDLILSDYQMNVKKCMCQSEKKYIQAPKIFIYFEQSFQQHSNQPVYFVLSPSDQLIAYI